MYKRFLFSIIGLINLFVWPQAASAGIIFHPITSWSHGPVTKHVPDGGGIPSGQYEVYEVCLNESFWAYAPLDSTVSGRTYLDDPHAGVFLEGRAGDRDQFPFTSGKPFTAGLRWFGGVAYNHFWSSTSDLGYHKVFYDAQWSKTGPVQIEWIVVQVIACN